MAGLGCPGLPGSGRCRAACVRAPATCFPSIHRAEPETPVAGRGGRGVLAAEARGSRLLPPPGPELAAPGRLAPTLGLASRPARGALCGRGGGRSSAWASSGPPGSLVWGPRRRPPGAWLWWRGLGAAGSPAPGPGRAGSSRCTSSSGRAGAEASGLGPGARTRDRAARPGPELLGSVAARPCRAGPARSHPPVALCLPLLRSAGSRVASLSGLPFGTRLSRAWRERGPRG